MKRPSITGGIITAFFLACISGILLHVDSFLFPNTYYSSLRLSLASAAGAYLIYLMLTRKRRRGRLLLIACSALILSAAAASASLFSFIILSVALIWISRSLLWHQSLIAGSLDAALCGTGLLLAVFCWLNTGSVFAAVWSFFLSQSLFVLIPQIRSLAACQENEQSMEKKLSQQFESAHNNAESALSQMMGAV